MTQAPGAPSAFFTLDHGGATTAAALVGHVSGRFRLLAAGAVPAAVAPEVLLGDLVTRVRAADPGLVPDAHRWERWTRVESRTSPPRTIVLAAASERSLAGLEAAFGNAGWRIVKRLTPERVDAIAATEALIARDLDTVALAAGPGEAGAMADLSALVSAAIAGRRDLHVVLAGEAELAGAVLPTDFVVRARWAGGRPGTEPLRDVADRLAIRPDRAASDGREETPVPAAEQSGGATPQFDGRRAFHRSIASLAAVLELRVDGVDIGFDAGTRVVADGTGVVRRIIRSEAALVPPSVCDDERLLDQIVGWCPLRDDAQTLRDRMRNLRLAPWRDISGDGGRIRLALARAALARLAAAWSVSATGGDDGTVASATGIAMPDLVVASGGAFVVAPAPAVALALIDALRDPGGRMLALDHVRILAPLGTLADEGDRRRLLADLADDVLLPLGSAILAPGLRASRRGTLRITTEGSPSEVALLPGSVQVVDLPPGLAATVELESPDELWVGVRTRRVLFDTAGGLGGLLVDTRDIPLRLPEHPERRREVLDAWQRPLWTSGDA